MVPLILANIGEKNSVKKVCGNDKTKKHLANLGFVPGAEIMLINSLGSDVIVNIKDARIALSEDLAKKIMI